MLLIAAVTSVSSKTNGTTLNLLPKAIYALWFNGHQVYHIFTKKLSFQPSLIDNANRPINSRNLPFELKTWYKQFQLYTHYVTYTFEVQTIQIRATIWRVVVSRWPLFCLHGKQAKRNPGIILVSGFNWLDSDTGWYKFNKMPREKTNFVAKNCCAATISAVTSGHNTTGRNMAQQFSIIAVWWLRLELSGQGVWGAGSVNK